MISFLQLVVSPIGPALVLLVGAGAVIVTGRWVHRPGWLTGLALFFVAVATWLFLGLRTEPVVPTYSRPWQPPLQSGTNLLWIGDGWNWYISGLILLLGGVGILLELNSGRDMGQIGGRRTHTALAIHLSVLSAGLLFVGSANVLTAMLTWVALDLITLVRGAVRTNATADSSEAAIPRPHQAKGLSLIGALLLLVGLLPAGPTGLGQPLQGGTLPSETIALMTLAALIRAGIYPFHLWLLPTRRDRVDVAERLLDHMIPVLCGLWLLGWTVELGAEYLFFQPDIIAILILGLLGSALAAWTANDQPNHTTFVLVTSAGLAALAGALAYEHGPAGLIWPTTAFALGGAMWLVGDQVWQTWGWQLPVSVGALALAGVPFTPGFLTQPSLARMLTAGQLFVALFGAFVVAQSIQIAALLRSWTDVQRPNTLTLGSGTTIRLLAATIALGIPLSIVGFFPEATAGVASIPNAIPPTLGQMPSVVADLPVWIAVALPLALGIGLVGVRPILWEWWGPWPGRISTITRLDWLSQVIWWGATQVSEGWGTALRVVEGVGYVGWVMVFVTVAYLLVR